MKKQSLTKLSFATLLFFAGVFSACGDGSTSSNNTDENKGSFSEVKDISDLGRCTDERDGDTVYVVEKMRDYVCVNHAWVDISELDDSGLSSGDVRSSSSVSGSEASSSSFNENAYTDENLVVKKRSILGVAQKGPFKFGSPVYLRELAGDSLHYSGKVYEDEISSNKGDFVIPNVNLIYPYVSVEVNGQYRNEITGTYSQKPLSLFALSDLVTDSRTKINVNLLTHLEYGRAMYLVRKGYSVYAAKKQADQELMTAFELPTTIKYSEDLSVFEDSEDDNVDYANASLMMLNLLFLGNRSDDEIIALIDNFTTDFEKDGVWDDESTKAAMADFAKEVDGAEIRANVKAWNILDIPNFEEQMEMFWNNVYGLGGCTSVRSGVITKNQNKYSKNFEAYYKCDAGSWVKATQLEYDTYGWGTGTVGEVKKGDVTDAKYVYRDGKWNQASVAEGGLGSCLAKNEGTILTYGPSYGLDYYVCKSRQWTKLTVAEADVYGWSAGTVGEVKKGTYTDAKYVYRNGKWNAASSVETALGSCTTSYTGNVKMNESTYYICKSSAWATATVLEYDTYGWSAGAAGEVKKGDVTDAKYVYRNGAWSAASAVEASLGSCLAKDEGTIQTYGSYYYACESTKWTKITATQADTYGWSAGEVGEVKKGTYTDTKYVYKDGKWGIADDLETLLGSCVAENANTVILKDGSYYACENTQWKELSVLEADTYGWATGETGEVKKGDVTDAMYVYRGGKWGVASELETLLGSCVTKNAGTVTLSSGTYYICKANEWTEASILEYDTYGLNCAKDGMLIDGFVNASNKYVCDAEEFRIATEDEVALNLGCTSYNKNQTILFEEEEWEVVTWICSGKWTEKERSYKYGTLKDSRDNKTYKTIKIGNQIWMAENLNYDPGDVSSMGSYAWSGCYNNKADSCAKYGRLYTWEVAMNDASCAYGKTCGASLNPTTPVRGICPSGWHLPSHHEFEELINYIDPSFGYDHTITAASSTAGKYLKSKSGWNSSGNGTDAYGFSALPGGYRLDAGSFENAGYYAYFWSSGGSSDYAFNLFLHYVDEYARLWESYMSDAESVRCLQD